MLGVVVYLTYCSSLCVSVCLCDYDKEKKFGGLRQSSSSESSLVSVQLFFRYIAHPKLLASECLAKHTHSPGKGIHLPHHRHSRSNQNPSLTGLNPGVESFVKVHQRIQHVFGAAANQEAVRWRREARSTS
jgi:hypothetical protein